MFCFRQSPCSSCQPQTSDCLFPQRLYRIPNFSSTRKMPDCFLTPLLDGKYLSLILLELWSCSLFQSYSDSCDIVHMGSSLQSRKHSWVNLRFKFKFDFISLFVLPRSHLVENQSTPRSPQGFVSGCSHNISILKRRRNDPRRYQPRRMRHITQQISPYLVRYLLKPPVIQQPTVRRCSSNQQLRTVNQRRFMQLIVIYQPRLLIQPVRKHLEIF
mgnify:CR=1 FL=1